MRISDWSSDVCSSDLRVQVVQFDRDAGIGLLEAGDQRAERLGAQRRVEDDLALLLRRVDYRLIVLRIVFRQLGRGRAADQRKEIGRASGRERVCQYV